MSEKAWFRPKEFSGGAEPASWEGWLLILGYCLLIAATLILGLLGPHMVLHLTWHTHAASPPAQRQWGAYLAVGAETLAFLVIARWKSSGPWFGSWKVRR